MSTTDDLILEMKAANSQTHSFVPWERDSTSAEIFRTTSALESLCKKINMTRDVCVLHDGDPQSVMVSRKVGRVDTLYTSDPDTSHLETVTSSFAKDAALQMDNMFLGFATGEHGTPPGTGYPMGTMLQNTVDSQHSLYNQAEHRFEVRPNDPYVASLLFGLTEYVKAPTPENRYRNRPGIIAHPAFRKLLRGHNSSQGTATFNGVRIFFTTAATATAKPSPQPNGNPLLFAGNLDALLLGIRSGPESNLVVHDDAWVEEAKKPEGLGFLYDLSYEDSSGEQREAFDELISERYGTTWVKSRIRRAFGIESFHKFQCLELV